MIIKKVVGHELYVYASNGSLLYKKWLNLGYGIVIQDDTPLGRAQGNFKSCDVFQHVTSVSAKQNDRL
jgi:hypothetical protein